MGLAARITRLERTRGTAPCAGCAVPTAAERGVGQRLVFSVLGDGEQGPDTSGDLCVACGRVRVYRVIVE